ncbi:sulfatase-like hydrolase/transferase [Fodinisporobacter ferrooxydans]|uniref:Sulfatase-like hydrolase/transferase n=1 Tax=Fodinisporobacter ferrooxydans TaxID=2901836 RepID=A0ABY4CHX8_9BACL|nr:sulfatase-like hydrolase/transferase [Alicyclobacillaceae bacterium MYW30-H2]
MIKQPNVIFIMTDQQRYDTLSVNGNKIIKTPNINELAKQSAIFDQMFVTSPICVPSRASFMTGRYPNTHRCRDLNYPLADDEVNLASIFKKRGYHLSLIGKNHVFSKNQLNMFDYLYLQSHQKSKNVTREELAYDSGIDPCLLDQYPTVTIADHAISYLEKRIDSPFFMWVSFPDPHSPYQVPEPYASLYDPERIPEPKIKPGELMTKPEGLRELQKIQKMDHVSMKSIKKMISIYYGMITLIDESIGRILSKIKELELEKDTIIIFTSDHGDYMGDHGLARKSWNFYDCLLRVPFMISWPGVIPIRRHTDCLVENVDLAPTLLELCNIDKQTGVQGTSLAPVLKGEQQFLKESIYATIGTPAKTKDSVKADTSGGGQPFWNVSALQGMMLRTKEWKLCIYANCEGELYNLSDDPEELNNLYGKTDTRIIESQLKTQLLLTRLRVDDPLPPSSSGF